MHEQVCYSEVKNNWYIHEVVSEHVGLYMENKLRFLVNYTFLSLNSAEKTVLT